ncbi:D-alanyl-D-alanine carboxypeptidase family protein [Paenibacillus sp. 1781tsa1]|uniref:D-alanyl-D-alanine carboxypeptidase family protein n=1 Tax=unclassified Paenibacillus TaxID=185978 RepID=UPI00209FDCA4|nr:D-alanyl-D-alanine carboxypeptidase family protein [Paenibacillus sp. 1781tsa1]MCP1185409.1 D-alanyl-D-alanine carboxypeptidase [Paenibacillus sp. 1781tsa1]
MRKITKVLACMLIPVFLLSSLGVTQAQATIQGPSTHAQSAALIDVTSGRILYSKDGDKELRIASLTKIMTAIVAIEHSKLDEKVKVSPTAFAKEGSSLYLKLGEEMTLENMLYGLMLRSGNDAASAIAEHVGGSEEGFVLLMNKKAEQIGLTHSHFMNPHGLDAEGHYSTANDLARLTAYALHNPVFKRIVATEDKSAPNPNESWEYSWHNKNKMLRMYEGADGVKTGYTKKAFRCLVSSATRNGQQLAAVTLNDGNDWNDHARMLDFGFEYFPLVEIAKQEQPVQNTDVVTGRGFWYPLAESEKSSLTKKLILHENRAQSETEGNKQSTDPTFGLAGRIDMQLDGKLVGSIPVYRKGSFIPPEPKTAESTLGGIGEVSSWAAAWRAVLSHLLSP